MAKTKEKKDESKIHEFFRDKGPDLVLNALKGFISNLSKNVVDAIHRTEKKFLDTLVSYLFFAVGSVFVAIALIFLIIQYMGLSVGWSFLVIGLIMLLWSLFLKKRSESISR